MLASAIITQKCVKSTCEYEMFLFFGGGLPFFCHWNVESVYIPYMQLAYISSDLTARKPNVKPQMLLHMKLRNEDNQNN